MNLLAMNFGGLQILIILALLFCVLSLIPWGNQWYLLAVSVLLTIVYILAGKG